MSSQQRLASLENVTPNDKAEALLGIDLGTVNSCIYVWVDGEAKLVPNEKGHPTTPSVVSFIEGRGFVGATAKSKMELYPESTITEIKRLIGLRYEDAAVKNHSDIVQYKIVRDKYGFAAIQIERDNNDKILTFSPIEISSMILKKLKVIAENFVRQQIKKAVITVPEHFNNAQRIATKQAAEIAGLTVISIFNEPTAAALTYCYRLLSSDSLKYVLVYDLGGGTFDVSILTVEDGLVDVRKTKENMHLGGIDFDKKLVNFCLQDIEKTVKDKDCIKNDKESLKRLRSQFEEAKCALTSDTTYEINLSHLFEGKAFTKKITRAQFNKLNQRYFDETIEIVKNVLEEAKMNATDIDEVILVGGSSRIPKIRQKLTELFGEKPMNITINADKAVAHGAAVRAGISIAKENDKLANMNLFDNSSWSIGIRVRRDNNRNSMKFLIKRNNRLPASAKDIITTNCDNQDEVDIDIYEEEDNDTRNNNLLGSFVLSGILFHKTTN